MKSFIFAQDRFRNKITTMAGSSGNISTERNTDELSRIVADEIA